MAAIGHHNACISRDSDYCVKKYSISQIWSITCAHGNFRHL